MAKDSDNYSEFHESGCQQSIHVESKASTMRLLRQGARSCPSDALPHRQTLLLPFTPQLTGFTNLQIVRRIRAAKLLILRESWFAHQAALHRVRTPGDGMLGCGGGESDGGELHQKRGSGLCNVQWVACG